MKTWIHSAALIALAPFPALAQTSPNPEGGEDDVIVTATRSGDAIPADRIGGSVTLLDRDALARRQTRDVADILRDVPGVSIGSVPGRTQIRLRGTEANQTLVLIDGIEVSDPFVGEFDLGTLIADDAARIEVLRGPQSALFGSDAIGGVINYITASGRETPGISARVEGGSFETVNAAARAGGVAGPLDYALTATLVSTDGTPNARGGSRRLGRDAGALAGKAGWSIGSNAKLVAVARYSRTQGDFNNSESDPADPRFGFIVDSPGARFENEAIYGLVRGELRLLDGRWTQALSAQVASTTRDGFDRGTRSFGDRGRRLKGSYEAALRLGAGPLRHRITFAADAEQERYRNTDPSGFAFTGARTAGNIGLVGQYELFFGERATLSGAVRRDINNRFADGTTYRIQASLRLTGTTRLRAAAGSGIKNPGFYELYGFIDGRFVGNPDLRPERSDSWEVGAEQSFAGDRVLIGGTYFNSRLSGEIFTTFPPPNFVATPANRKTLSRQHGIELFARARLGEAWRLDAAYTHLRAREAGAPEVRRPANIASVALDWRAPHRSGGVTLIVRYNGATDDLAFTDPSFIPVRVRLGDFVLVNLNGDIALTRRISLFGRIENLLGQNYEQVFSFTNPRRTAFVGLRARF